MSCASNAGWAYPGGQRRPGMHAAAQLSLTDWVREDLNLDGGPRIAVFRHGRQDPSAPTILLVHGLGHWTQAAWEPMVCRLSREYRLIGFDLPGSGESAKPNLRYDLEFFTNTLAAIVKRLGL